MHNLPPLDVEQQVILSKITDWFHTGSTTEFRFGGLAGTGKTTVMGHVPGALSGFSVQFCAPTGKAASVLRKKGATNAKTIHSMLYFPEPVIDHEDDCVCKVHKRNSAGECIPNEASTDDEIGCQRIGCTCPSHITWIKRSDHICDCVGTCKVMMDLPNLIVVDESSMVGSDLYADLRELGTKILWVGDPGQLMPVGERRSPAMSPETLDVKLTQIRRQAADNAIIRLAHAVRRHGLDGLKAEENWGPEIRIATMPLKNAKIDYQPGADKLVLCWKNATRVTHNAKIRARRGFEPGTLMVGDRVVCLRNIREAQPDGPTVLTTANGQMGTVLEIIKDEKFIWTARVQMDDDIDHGPRVFKMVKAQFGNPKTLNDAYGALFDYGYVITTHKAQGSQAAEVVVLAEGGHFNGENHGAKDRQWLYTATTRAAERLTIVLPGGAR